MDEFDGRIDRVRAFIARGRISDMVARGWSVVRVGDEGGVWMEGPDPDNGPEPLFTLGTALPVRGLTTRVRAA